MRIFCKKTLSLIMAFCLILSLSINILPASAYAEQVESTVNHQHNEDCYQEYWILRDVDDRNSLELVPILICSDESRESEIHTHNLDCLELVDNHYCVCSDSDEADHLHNEDCYAQVWTLTCENKDDGFLEVLGSVCKRLFGNNAESIDEDKTGEGEDASSIQSNSDLDTGMSDNNTASSSSNPETDVESTTEDPSTQENGSDNNEQMSSVDDADSIDTNTSVVEYESDEDAKAEDRTNDSTQEPSSDLTDSKNIIIANRDEDSSENSSESTEETTEHRILSDAGSTKPEELIEEARGGTVETEDVDSVRPEETFAPDTQNVQTENSEEENSTEDLSAIEAILDAVQVIKSEFFQREQEIDGVKVTVTAKSGVFPDTASLLVSRISEEDQESIDSIIEQERDNNHRVAASYSYDIKIVDENDNELQPGPEDNVSVSFSLAEASNKNLNAQVYHITEEDDTLSAETLTVSTSGHTVTANTDGFSYYTVEFTYNEMIYVIDGDSAINLSDILEFFALSGTPSYVESSNPDLFSVENTDGEWIVTAHNAFQSEEWLKVIIDGIEYEIIVTDDLTVPVSGRFGQNNSVTWEIDADNNMVIRPTTAESTGIITNLANGKYNANTAGPCWPWHNYRSQIKSISFEGNVTTVASGQMRGMFCNCTSLTSVDLSNFDMSNITITNDMFYGCSSLTSIDLKDLIHADSTQINRMLQDCSNLQHLSVGGNWSTVTQSNNCFSGITESVTELELDGAIIPANILTSIFSQLTAVDTLIFSGDKGSLDPTDVFTYFPNVSTVKLQNGTNTPETALDLFGFPIGKNLITDGSVCTEPLSGGIWSYDDGSGNVQTDLTHDDVNALMVDGKLPVGTFTKTDIGQVEPGGDVSSSVKWRFTNGKLKIWPTNGVSGTLDSVIDAANWPWNENNTTFPAAQVKEVEVIGIVSAGTNAVNMFQNLEGLQKVDLTGLDISSCSDISGMFDGCRSLENIDLHFYNNSSNQPVVIDRLFHNCNSLKNLHLEKASAFMSNLGDASIFAGCTDLETINLSNITAAGIELPSSGHPKMKTIIADNTGTAART